MLSLPASFDTNRPSSSEWLRIYNGFGRQIAGRGNNLSSADTQHGTIVGSGLLIDTFAGTSTGEVIPEISTGITVVMIAQKRGQISISDFIFGEHLTGTSSYNYGFYESKSTGNLLFYVTASASGIAATGGTAWVAGAGPQVWVGTYGDGDNNVRLYLNGRQVGSIAQTGNITRTAGAFLRSCFWANGAPNFIFLAGAVANRRLSPDEIAAKFPSAFAGMRTLFAPRRIWVPVSAGGTTHEATGSLSASAATVAGSANAVTTFTSTGALTSQAATLAGTATHLTLHPSSGALEAQAATLSGTANHVTVHASSGTLTAQAATLAGSANLAVGGAFTAVGALSSQSATVSGTAVHYTLHTAAGDLVADAASISGSALHEGDGAEVAKPFTGAGRPRRTRQRVVVEIDGEDFIAESSEEAQAILDQAKEAAEEKAKVAIERATKARNRPTRKVMADARKALELPAISAPDLGGYAEEISRQIEDIYQSAIQTIEVAALLRKRELEEEDDEDILLLIA